MTTLPDRFRAVLRAYLDEAHGRRVELARAIHTHPQQVSDWLTRGRFPSHAKTLQILRWLPAKVRALVFAKRPPQ